MADARRSRLAGLAGAILCEVKRINWATAGCFFCSSSHFSNISRWLCLAVVLLSSDLTSRSDGGSTALNEGLELWATFFLPCFYPGWKLYDKNLPVGCELSHI